QNCTKLKSVTIPGSVTSIGVAAFGDCQGLKSLAIPGSVANIRGNAFIFCYGLTNVTIPSSVVSIGVDAFGDEESLRAFTVDSGNPAYSTLAGVLFNKDQTTLIQYPAGLTGWYTIPGSVTSIYQNAFAYCGRLSGVTIPGSVTNIE